MKKNYEIREVHLLIRTNNIKYCDKDCNYLSVFTEDDGSWNRPICKIFDVSLDLTSKKTKIQRCQECHCAEFPTVQKFCKRRFFKFELTPLSEEARAERMPQKPHELVGASHDNVHRDLGRSRPVDAVRFNKKGKVVK